MKTNKVYLFGVVTKLILQFIISDIKSAMENNSKTNVCLMFPNNSTSVHLAQHLTSEMANIAFFIPEGIHEQAAFTSYEEAKIAAFGIDVIIRKVDAYRQLDSFDTIFFPFLDVNPQKSRSAFSSMCQNLFR